VPIGSRQGVFTFFSGGPSSSPPKHLPFRHFGASEMTFVRFPGFGCACFFPSFLPPTGFPPATLFSLGSPFSQAPFPRPPSPFSLDRPAPYWPVGQYFLFAVFFSSIEPQAFSVFGPPCIPLLFLAPALTSCVLSLFRIFLYPSSTPANHRPKILRFPFSLSANLVRPTHLHRDSLTQISF